MEGCLRRLLASVCASAPGRTARKTVAMSMSSEIADFVDDPSMQRLVERD